MARQRASDTAVTPPVELIQHAHGISIVVLRGEHDLSTRGDVEEALTRACVHEAVLVDFSECAFIDSTSIGLLVSAYKAQLARAGRLSLVVSVEARNVSRTLHLTALDTVIPIHETRNDGLAAFVSDGHVIQIRDLRTRFDQPENYRAACSCGWSGDVHSGRPGERLARRDGAQHVDAERTARGRFRRPSAG